GTAVDFQTETNAYFYGTRFFSYLAYSYGPDKVVQWLRREEGSKRYYANQFEFVFGKPLEDAWNDWIVFEREFQQANLAAVRKVPLTPKQPLTSAALGSISRSFVDQKSNTLIGCFYYPGVVAYIGAMSLQDGTLTHIVDIKGPMKYKVTSTAYNPVNQVLFFTADNDKKRDLMAVDVHHRKARVMIRNARIGDLAFNANDNSLWGVRNENGIVSLVRVRDPYGEWEDIHAWPYGQALTDLDISPDGALLSATMEEINGDQFLRIFKLEDLLNGQTEPIKQFDFGRAVPEGFVFTPDGKYLYGSSYYTGVSNIFRYEIATGEIEAVSNAETGFFMPVPQEDGSLIVFEYTGTGLLPTRINPVPLEDLSATTFLGNEIVKKYPEVMKWGVGSPADIDLDALKPQQGEYHPGRELEYAAGFPIIQGYLGTVALGWAAELQDPLMFNELKLDAAYSLDGSLESSQKLHANAEYTTLSWRFQYWHNYADFYDLFGPTERARKGDAYIVGYRNPLIYDGSRRLDLDTEVAYYTGLNTLPGNQNVAAEFTRLLSATAGLEFENTEESLGAIDHEKGYQWNLKGYLDQASSQLYPKIRGGFDFGFALPWKHSSVWLYNEAGISGGDRADTLSNWYFGAFGNNYVDDDEIKRYREYQSFPGFEIDQLSAQNFARTLLEWNLPPLRFAEIGIPGFFLSSARTALFAGVLFT
ncbi:MAG: TolB family protein, partial [Lysobacterales bacterium]